MHSPHAMPLQPSALSSQGLDTHIAIGLGARQAQAQVALRQLAPGSAPGVHGGAEAIRVREWPMQSMSPQFSAALPVETPAAPQRQAITLQLQDDAKRDYLDEHLCSVWDTRKLFFMHPHDMAAHGLNEGDSVLVSAATQAAQIRHTIRLRVIPYDLPRGTARSYFRECAALVTADSSSAQALPGIRVHVMSTAH